MEKMVEIFNNFVDFKMHEDAKKICETAGLMCQFFKKKQFINAIFQLLKVIFFFSLYTLKIICMILFTIFCLIFGGAIRIGKWIWKSALIQSIKEKAKKEKELTEKIGNTQRLTVEICNFLIEVAQRNNVETSIEDLYPSYQFNKEVFTNNAYIEINVGHILEKIKPENLEIIVQRKIKPKLKNKKNLKNKIFIKGDFLVIDKALE